MLKIKTIFIICIILANSVNAFAKKQIIRIGAGSLLGSDYTVALELCKFIKLSNTNIKCEVKSIKSSIKNLSYLQNNKNTADKLKAIKIYKKYFENNDA